MYVRIQQEGRQQRNHEGCGSGTQQDRHLADDDLDWSIDAKRTRVFLPKLQPVPHTNRRAENGLGAFDSLEDGHVHDGYRIDYLRAHIEAVEQAVEDGCSILSYCLVFYGSVELAERLSEALRPGLCRPR